MSAEDVDRVRTCCVNLFTEHTRAAGESYCQHFAYAVGTGLKLVGLGVVSVVHGLCPFLFTSTVSDYVPKLSTELEARRRKVATHKTQPRPPAHPPRGFKSREHESSSRSSDSVVKRRSGVSGADPSVLVAATVPLEPESLPTTGLS